MFGRVMLHSLRAQVKWKYPLRPITDQRLGRTGPKGTRLLVVGGIHRYLVLFPSGPPFRYESPSVPGKKLRPLWRNFESGPPFTFTILDFLLGHTMKHMEIAGSIRHLRGSLPVFRQIVNASAPIFATSRELEEMGAPNRPCKHQATLRTSLGLCLRLL